MAEETNSVLMDPPVMTEEQEKLVSVIAGMENDGVPEEVIKEKIPALQKQIKKDKEDDVFFGAVIPEVKIKEPKDTKLSKKDLTKPEEEVVKKGKKYYDGLGVDFDESVPGADVIKVDDNRYKVGTGSSTRKPREVVVDELKTIANNAKEVKKANLNGLFDGDLYDEAFDYAYTMNFRMADDLSTEEMLTYRDEVFDNAMDVFHNSPKGTQLVEQMSNEINEKLEAFVVELVDNVIKGNVKPEDASDAISVKYDEIKYEVLSNNEEYQTVVNTNKAAFGSVFNRDIANAMQVDNIDDIYPWYAKSDFIGGAWEQLALHVPKASKIIGRMYLNKDYRNIINYKEALINGTELPAVGGGNIPNVNQVKNGKVYYTGMRQISSYSTPSLSIKGGYYEVDDLINRLNTAEQAYNAKILENILQTQEIQDILNKINNPKAYHSLDGWQREMGKQTMNLMGSIFTSIFYPFALEGAGAYEEMIQLEAQKRGYGSNPTPAQMIEIIEDGSVSEKMENISKGVGFVNAGLEVATDGFIIFKASKVKIMPVQLYNEIKKGYYKNAIKTGGNIGKTMAQTAATEVPTELIQNTVTTAGVDAGSSYGNTWDNYFTEQKETFLTTALTSPFLGGGAAVTVQTAKNSYNAIFDLLNPDAMTNAVKNDIAKLTEKLNKEVTSEDYQTQIDVLNELDNLLRNESYGGLAWTKDPKAKEVIKEKLYNLAELNIKFENNKSKTKELKEKLGDSYKDSEQQQIQKQELDDLLKQEKKVNEDILRAKVKAWKNKTYKEVATRHNQDPNSDRKYKVFDSNKELLAFLKKEHGLDGRSKEARAVKRGDVNGIYDGIQVDGKKLIVVSLENVNNNIDKEDFSLLAGNVDIHEDIHADMDGMQDSDKLNLINKVQDLLLNDPGLINLKIQQSLINRAYATLTPGVDFKVVNGKYVPLSKRGLEEYMPYLSDAMFEYRVQDFSIEGRDGLDNLRAAFQDILKTDLTDTDILNFIREINRGGVRTGYEQQAVDWFLDKEGNPLVYHYNDINIVEEKATLMSQSPGETSMEARKIMGFGPDVSAKNKEIQDLMIANVNNPRKIKSLQGDFIINNAGAIMVNERKWQADKDFVVSQDDWITEVFAIASDLSRTYKPLLTEIEFDAIVEKNKEENKPIPKKVVAKDIDGEANIVNPVNFGAYLQGLMPLRINKITIDATKRLELKKKEEQENKDLYSGTSIDEVLDAQEAIKNNRQTSKLREALGIEAGENIYDEITLTAAENAKIVSDNTQDPKDFPTNLIKKNKKDWRYIRNTLFPGSPSYTTDKYINFVKDKIDIIHESMPVAEVTKLRLGLTEEVVLDPETGRVRMRKKESEFDKTANVKNVTAGNTRRTKVKLTPALKAMLIEELLKLEQIQNLKDAGVSQTAINKELRLDMAQERVLQYLTNIVFNDAVITGLKSPAFIDKHGDAASIVGQVAATLKKNIDFQFSSSKGVKTTIYSTTPDFETRVMNIIQTIRTFDITDKEGINTYLDGLNEEFALKELVRKTYDLGYLTSLEAEQFKQSVVKLKDKKLNDFIVPRKDKGGQGSLRYNENSLNSLQKAGLELAKVLGPEVFEVLKGFDILGYHYGALDAAQNKTEKINGKTVNVIDSDGNEVRGKYYEKLQELKAAIEDLEIELPDGLILNDVRLMNPQSELATKLKAVTRLETREEKLAKLNEVRSDGTTLAQEIQKANIANIKLIEFIADKLKEVYQSNSKVTKLDVYNLLQAQTSIKNGFRSLSKLDYLTLRDGVYTFNKGEHIMPNSITMFDIYKYVIGETNTLDLDNHTQWFTKKSITDIMDTDPATGKMTLRTNPAGELRFNFISKQDQSDVYSPDGKQLEDIIVENQTLKVIEESKALNIAGQSFGVTVLDFDDTLATTKSKVKFTAPGQTLVYNASPKSIKELGKRSGIIYLATDKKEADAYAKSNRGEVRGFVIDNANIVNEDVVLKEMKDQGIDTSEGLLYEMIDSRFPDFYIGKKNVDKVFNALRKKGIKAFKYEDGSQVSSKTTKSIAVIDKSVISEPGTLNAEQYAKNYVDLADKGYTFDFSEFNEVVEGKIAPLFNKALKLQGKFGTQNMFILTARPAEAAAAIHAFLKANGLNIPLENITGLGNSTAEAKAMWIADKVASEGYNDVYFADDAEQNVQAVENVLDQLGVKKKVTLADPNYMFSLSPRFNEILEETEGMDRNKIFSDAQGKIRGAAVDKYKILPIMPSGQDFKGLIYNFLGKGVQGEQQLKWFEDNLINPYINGTNKINEARQDIGKNYKNLIKKLPKIKTQLTDLVPDTNYTYGQAVRVYLWDFYGMEIPGISKRDQKLLTKIVKDSKDLTTFAMGLSKITQLDAGYVEPTEYWTAEGIGSDLYSLTSRVGRTKFLADFIKARQEIFGEFDSRGRLSGPNIAKIEAIYGNKFKEALEDILYRMEFGRKRNQGDDRITSNWDNWINASVGSIMFFNMRSAVLQLISATNYIDTENNNIFAAATAFANQPNYWRTVGKLWNSPFLQERLSGESRTINEAELAAYVQGKENKVKAAISYLLKIGFTPTRVADATAITFGGATYFINQKKAYIKDGLTEQEAEAKAMEDWIAKSQESQQSSDAMMISQQQAGNLGRIILAFKNTPMQYARLIDKAVRDIKNGRGSTKANLSKIAYYGFVQNLMFNMLQNAIWKANADDEEIDEKTVRTINGMFDSLVGGLGLGGNVVVTLKNGVLEYKKQDERGWNADHTYTILRLANLSPTIGSKLRKIYSSIQTEKFNKEAIKEMSYFNPGNPAFDVMANLISGLTNIPLDRAVNKVQNLIVAADSETEFWDSFALTLGWNTWDLGIEDEAKKVKRQIKEKKKAAKKRCTAIKSSGEQCKNKTTNKSGKCYAHDK